MKTERTTQIASMLAETTTRRGALCFLAGVAMASTGLAALSAADADAKKKGQRKDKKGGNERCGDKRLRVPHDGKVVHTPTLEKGKRYRLRVSDSVTATNPLLVTPMGIDAGYVFRQDGGSTTAYDNTNGIDYGLSVDGESASWGDYASNHVYERKVVGQGKKLALHLVTESESEFSQSAQSELVAQRIISTPLELDLSGSLTVEILCD